MTRTPIYKIKIKADINPFNPSPLPDPEGTVLLMANQGAYFAEIERDKDAESAIERLTPKEPEFKAMAGFEASVASHLACPTCGGGVTNYWVPGTRPAHCQFCGQALKWEEGDQ